MTRRLAAWALVGAVGTAGAWAALAARAGAEPKLDLAGILDRNAAARGGQDAWAKVQTLAWAGHVERAGGSGPRPQFLLEQKRPNLTRFELVSEGQRSVRVFDGQQGWKQRADASGRPELQPFGEEELRAARDVLGIDGPVLGARARGLELSLQGVDEVEGSPAYRLGARLPSGAEQHLWVDAKTFLEVKYDRPGRDAAGRPTTVAVSLRRYQAWDGLQLPLVIETGGPGGDQLVIERVAINPNLPGESFTRPGTHGTRRGGVVVDARAAAGRPAARSGGWSTGGGPSASAPRPIEGSEPGP
jgi:hypothetical protein